MKSTVINIFEYINPGKLFGPILTKELIVSSRRRRNFLIRFFYPIVLAGFVGFIFMSFIGFNNQPSNVVKVSQMAQNGIRITTTIIWFQFIIVQLLAMIMLSNAISEEIYNKTLGVLMTTPISSFQVVFGKLFSKLIQLLLVISISFPVLAIIRVFGGVPWNFVFSSICITLTSAIFAGSLSLLFSIYSRSSQQVISKALSICFLIYAVPPILYEIFNQIDKKVIAFHIKDSGLFFINPFIQLQNISMYITSSSVSGFTEPWLFHCLLMISFSVALLLLTGICVRKAGLRQITGQGGLLLTRKERKIADKKRKMLYTAQNISGKIRDIKWPPIIWREVSNPLIKTGRISAVLNVSMLAIILILIYSLCVYFNTLTRPETQIVFVVIYLFIALIRTSTCASICITSEKEARSWPILLMSTLDSKDITLQKIIGSLIRTWPFWLLLAVHLVVFIALGVINVGVLVPLSLLVLTSAFLASSVGVMISSICKRSSTSTTINTLTVIFFFVPVCCTPLFLASPLFAAAVIMGNWAGFNGRTGFSEMFFFSSVDGFWIAFFSPYSFIIYIMLYLLIIFAAYVVSVDNIRRRIL